MKTVEIILREVSGYENKEVMIEKRIVFLRQYKIEELKRDTGLLGDLLREEEE